MAMGDLDFSEIKSRLQQWDIQLQLSEAFSAKEPDHRERIRLVLFKKFGEKQNLLSLDLLPDTEECSISVSHCPSMGGFAWTPKPFRIGFDIEDQARIDNKVAARIATEKEFSKAPKASYLWVAKEAAFKCIINENLMNVSQIRIEDWHLGDDGTYEFEAKFQTQKCQGFVVEQSEHVMGFARRNELNPKDQVTITV